MKMRNASIIILTILMLSLLCACTNPEPAAKDSVEYKGENYILLEFPANLLFYDLAHEIVCEEDEICPVESLQWEIVYHEGDLYCKEEDVKKAESYYADEKNYEWSVTIESQKGETTYPLTMSEEAITYLYALDTEEKEEAIFFDEIEKMATLKKVSKDGVVQARTELAYYKNNWYWRTEIIDESKEKDGTWPEYIQKLPQDLFSLPIGE